MKVCQKCQQPKALSEFKRNWKSPDGHIHVCRQCLEPPAPRPSMLVYEFDRSALNGQKDFLQRYGRRSLNKRPPCVIVSVPYAERRALERFCDLIALDRLAIYPLPRENRAEDRLGVVLYHVTMSQGLIFYPGCLQRQPSQNQAQAA